jgi:hypothetical protein
MICKYDCKLYRGKRNPINPSPKSLYSVDHTLTDTILVVYCSNQDLIHRKLCGVLSSIPRKLFNQIAKPILLGVWHVIIN